MNLIALSILTVGMSYIGITEKDGTACLIGLVGSILILLNALH